MIEIRYYLDRGGREGLGRTGARRTGQPVKREDGGDGVLEYRIDWGPGYRLNFGRDGDVLVILLVGGTKRRQQRDIEAAQLIWADYKRRRPKPR